MTAPNPTYTASLSFKSLRKFAAVKFGVCVCFSSGHYEAVSNGTATHPRSPQFATIASLFFEDLGPATQVRRREGSPPCLVRRQTARPSPACLTPKPVVRLVVIVIITGFAISIFEVHPHCIWFPLLFAALAALLVGDIGMRGHPDLATHTLKRPKALLAEKFRGGEPVPAAGNWRPEPLYQSSLAGIFEVVLYHPSTLGRVAWSWMFSPLVLHVRIAIDERQQAYLALASSVSFSFA